MGKMRFEVEPSKPSPWAKPYTVYACEHPKESFTDGKPFQLIASGEGVEVHGDLRIENTSDLEIFAKTLSEAWKEHLRLAPKLNQNSAGH